MPCVQLKGKIALFVLVCALLFIAAGSASAEENVTELKIEDITTPIRAGERLSFSFTVGNRLGPPCSGQLEYWFEKDGEKIVQGHDTVYLETAETKMETASLIMPPGLEGIRNFYLQMQCNEASVLASRIIHIDTGIPKLPQFKTLDVSESTEDIQVTFSYTLESDQASPVPLYVEEQIERDGNVLWTNSQSMAIAGSKEIKRLGPILPAGSYKVVAKATYGNETAQIVREFTVTPAAMPSILPMLAIAGLALLLFAAIAVTTRFIFSAKKPFRQLVPVHLLRGRAEARNRFCPVESESSGVLDSYEMDTLLDQAGFKESKREKAIQFAERTPVAQLVRGCIITDKKDRMACETTVTITVSNNSNRNWKNVEILAEIPEFLAESVSEIEADYEMHAVKGKAIARFLLPKVGAMQSASVSFKAAKMVSQAEANSVQLPAVIKYKEGKPLVIAQVKVEKDSEQAKEAEALLKEEKIAVKKSKRKKKGRKKRK